MPTLALDDAVCGSIGEAFAADLDDLSLRGLFLASSSPLAALSTGLSLSADVAGTAQLVDVDGLLDLSVRAVVAGVSTFSGEARASWACEAAVSGAADLVAQLGGKLALSADVAGVATIGYTQPELEATVDGVATFDALGPSAKLALAAEVLAGASASAQLRAGLALQAACRSSLIFEAAFPAAALGLVATSPASASFGASLGLAVDLVATVAGVAAPSAGLGLLFWLAAEFQGGSHVPAVVALEAHAAGVGASWAAAGGVLALQAAAAGAGSLSADVAQVGVIVDLET